MTFRRIFALTMFLFYNSGILSACEKKITYILKFTEVFISVLYSKNI